MEKSFAIATFNTLNLLHPGVFFKGRPKDKAYPQNVYDEKIDWIVRILKEGNVSLVGLQELFSFEALEKVAKEAQFPHIYAPDIESAQNITTDPTGRQEAAGPFVGLLSKYPITAKKSVVNFPDETSSIEIQAGESSTELKRLPFTRFQRPVIQADVQLRSDVTATVFVAHLKSKRPQLLETEKDRGKDPIVNAVGKTRSLIIRAAESVALRKLIVNATQNNTQPVILFGDLNDDLLSVTTQIIAGEEPFKGSLETKKVEWDRLLYSVHDLEEQERYRDVSYTHIFNSRYELLDHIFVSQEFFYRNPARIATVRNTRIFNDHLLDEHRVVNRPKPGASPRSDHGIPVTEIEWKS